MAYGWEDDRIQSAGKKWQDAQKRGDQAGMDAAASEAQRLRNEVYGYKVNQNNGQPTVTDGSKWTGSNPYKNYQQSVGIGSGSPYANTQSNAARQSGGSSSSRNSAYSNQYTNGYDDLISSNQQAYKDLLRQAEQQSRLATEQGVARLEGNRVGINQNYDEMARQAYVQKMQTEKNLPQALAGQGLTGGASETARLAVDTSYGNNLNESEQARQNALTSLDQSIADLRSTGDLNLAEQQMAIQQQALTDHNNVYAQKIAQDNWLKQYQQQSQDTERQRLIDQIPARYDDYTAYINELEGNGDPSDDWLIPYVKMHRNDKVTDMKSQEAAAAQQDFENQMLYDKTQAAVNRAYRTGTSGRSGGSGGAYKPRLTASQAMSAYSNGVRTDDVVEALAFYYGMDIGTKGGRATTRKLYPGSSF